MTAQKKRTYDRGLKAEGFAVLWLKLKGYQILAQRYKTPVGEVDIIARRGNIMLLLK